MRISLPTSLLALVVIVVGSASGEAVRGPECPDGFAFGHECTEYNAMNECQTKLNQVYGPDCDPVCARCSGDNFNCFTTVVQCEL